MADNMQSSLDAVRAIWEAADRALDQCDGCDNIQLPDLMRQIAVSEGWDEKTVNANDAVVRFYVRNHTDWAITKGRCGGVIPRAVWEKKQAVKSAKAAAKKEMQAKLDEMVLAANVAQPVVEGKTFTSTDEEFEESCNTVRAENASVSVMQQVADQQNALDARHAPVDEGRKAFLDTMVEMGQKLLDEMDESPHDVSEVEDVFASIDDEDVVDEEFDELENEL